MKIKIASIHHADAIAALNLTAYSDYAEKLGDEWPAMQREISTIVPLMEKLQFFIITEDQEVVGSIGYAKPNSAENRLFPPEWAHIRLLAVHPKARKRGMAGVLLQHVIDRARQDSAEVIGLHSSTLMISARSLYSHLGFESDGTSFDLFGVRYDRFMLKLK